MMSTYCMRCKTMRDMQNPQSIIVNDGGQVTTARCEVCGTILFRTGG
jgi:RNase P subunit RPR2